MDHCKVKCAQKETFIPYRRTKENLWRSLQENCPNKEFFMVHIFQYLDWIRTRITPCLEIFHPVTYSIFRVLLRQLKDPYSNPYDRQNKNIRLSNFNNKKIKDDSRIFFSYDISMPGLSRVDPFRLLLFNWKFLVFLVLQLLIVSFL